jgi:hypothetical protein
MCDEHAYLSGIYGGGDHHIGGLEYTECCKLNQIRKESEDITIGHPT